MFVFGESPGVTELCWACRWLTKFPQAIRVTLFASDLDYNMV
jgi:hypothetical protein